MRAKIESRLRLDRTIPKIYLLKYQRKTVTGPFWSIYNTVYKIYRDLEEEL